MFGTYRRPSRERREQKLRWAVDALCEEAERLERASDQRDHVIATLITNLQAGVATDQILDWWEQTGKAMLARDPADQHSEVE